MQTSSRLPVHIHRLEDRVEHRLKGAIICQQHAKVFMSLFKFCKVIAVVIPARGGRHVACYVPLHPKGGSFTLMHGRLVQVIMGVGVGAAG